MSNFKLIAIQPLKNCNKNFVKILQLETIYQFHNEYDFSKFSDKNKILKINSSSSLDLYSFKNISGKKIDLNISAIAGSNGSGKSSLVELFYIFCYNLSVINKVLFDEEEERYLNEEDIVPEIYLDVFYSLDNKIFLIRLKNKNITLFELIDNKFEKTNNKINLNDFFYTIAINYSLHALNSNVLGDWVRRIFHKNDGYQTPIVLNPYRKDGVIDINKEDYLVQSRLISNILGKINSNLKPKDSLRNVIDKKIAHRLLVSINREKFKYDENEKPIFELTEKYGDSILPIVYKYFNNGNQPKKNTLLIRYAKEYIIYKLISIASKYQPYKRLLQFFYDDKNKIDTFLKMLKEDNSHVTFKLRQAINFLSNELYLNRKESFNLTVAHLSKKLEAESNLKNKDLIDILPPAFFNIDIEFKDSDTLSQMSSGEKQRIYSIATLVYHLNNLASTSSKIVNFKFNSVNIIFDEIELYFHPELQRNLINDISESLKRIDLREITGLNIILITHSPFILSDIPENNILFLDENGLPVTNRENIKTFGGNIHELLAHSFFLENGLIGQFAKNRIQQIIDTLNEKKTIENDEKERILKQIEIIGEPFLKEKLLEKFYSKFETEKRIKFLKDEIERLQNND